MREDTDRGVLDYPYGASPLMPAWGSVKGRSLASLAVACAACGAWLCHLAGRPVNDIALLAMLPGALAFTLAFAPEPVTRLGTMAKDLLCLATAGACLVGPWIHYLIACVPALLACAVAMDRWLPTGVRLPVRYRLMRREPPSC